MSQNSSSDQTRFLALLEYEVNNRMMALIAMERLRVKNQAKPDGKFWHAYYELELLNQRMFEPAIKKYGFKLEKTFKQKSLAKIWAAFSALMPKTALNSISESTNKYVADLEEMARLAPDDQPFYDYVVEQEKVQAQGMMLLREEKYQQAVEVMQSFIDGYRQPIAA